MTFPAILFLEDGTVYKGLGFGNQSLSVGEIVFNTSMSGYQEIITDPVLRKTNHCFYSSPYREYWN